MKEQLAVPYAFATTQHFAPWRFARPPQIVVDCKLGNQPVRRGFSPLGTQRSAKQCQGFGHDAAERSTRPFRGSWFRVRRFSGTSIKPRDSHLTALQSFVRGRILLWHLSELWDSVRAGARRSFEALQAGSEELGTHRKMPVHLSSWERSSASTSRTKDTGLFECAASALTWPTVFETGALEEVPSDLDFRTRE